MGTSHTFMALVPSSVYQRLKEMSIPKITQLPLDFLSNSFQVKPQTKTFKTKPRDGATLEECFKTANEFIRANSEGYTRIEFPFDNYYYVIAKLNQSEEPK